jgi:hypothetical protein
VCVEEVIANTISMVDGLGPESSEEGGPELAFSEHQAHNLSASDECPGATAVRELYLHFGNG